MTKSKLRISPRTINESIIGLTIDKLIKKEGLQYPGEVYTERLRQDMIQGETPQQMIREIFGRRKKLTTDEFCLKLVQLYDNPQSYIGKYFRTTGKEALMQLARMRSVADSFCLSALALGEYAYQQGMLQWSGTELRKTLSKHL